MSVVVGYVPTPTGYLAVTEGARQARWRDAELVIVNVVGSGGFRRPTAADEKDLDALGERLTADQVRHSIRHLDIDTERAAEEILTVAAETAAELIVVGLHRRSPVAKAVLGSNAQRVLLGAECPVLLVRDADE